MYSQNKKCFGRCAALLCAISLLAVPVEARADAMAQSGSNVEKQNYTVRSSPVGSYLSAPGDGTLMRVQACDGGAVLVEYYDSSYNLAMNLAIPAELPIFGGFYEMDGSYYIVSGQENPQQNADLEVYRVTKYDHSWNRLGSVGLHDCNTTVPFQSGSLRFARCGKYLLVRTSHRMYKSSDGLNHQANVTFQVDTDSMQITDSLTQVSNSNMGYVSHSFNQFIQMDGNHIVAVDHGDAYPRSLVLLKYKTDASSGKFTPDYWKNPCDAIDLIKFSGAIGQNSTGASAGGFQILDDGYVVAGNSVPQDASAGSRYTRNIFVASVPKGSTTASLKWITNYAEGDGTTSTPQLVKVSGNQAILLWSRDRMVYYIAIDGNGNPVSDPYVLPGELSDCAPILNGDRIVWYTWTNDKVTFYDININDLAVAAIH